MKILDPIEARLIAVMEKTMDEMVRLYGEGKSTGAISEEVGFSRSTIRRYLKLRGVTLGKRGSPRQVNESYIELAKSMRKQGETWAEIEKKIGYSARQLQFWLYGK